MRCTEALPILQERKLAALGQYSLLCTDVAGGGCTQCMTTTQCKQMVCEVYTLMQDESVWLCIVFQGSGLRV
jgi:hypothetical protein